MKRFILPVILLLALLLRIVSIDKIPVGFTPDEASFGYDAYSILHAGRDQWGNFLPVVLKSFGDYKSPLYAYLTIPTVAIFGLNVFATRLPNAIIGVLAVLATYLLTKEVFDRLKIKNPLIFALISAFLVSISSWTVMLSRGAFEANLITFFIPFGIYLFLKKKFGWSALIFGLSLFTYHSAKVIAPLVIVGLIITMWKDLKASETKQYFFPIGILVLFTGLFVYSQIIGGVGRINERIIFQGALEAGAAAKIESIQKGMNPVLARLIHNKYQVVAQRFISNYLQYFSVKFLFKQGPAETTYGMIPGVGALYIFEGILLIGLIPAILKKETRKTVLVLLGWLIIAPIPAALASGVGYSANRAEGMIPAFQVLETFGIYGWVIIFSRFDKKILSMISFSFALLIAFELQKTFKTYFVNSPLVAGKGMLAENLESVGWVSQNSNGKNIVISRELSEPQIYVAFANKWDPSDYQNSTKNWKVITWIDQIPEYRLGNYTFRNIDWKTDKYLGNTIFVGKPDEFPSTVKAVKSFSYPDGRISIMVIDISRSLYAKSY